MSRQGAVGETGGGYVRSAASPQRSSPALATVNARRGAYCSSSHACLHFSSTFLLGDDDVPLVRHCNEVFITPACAGGAILWAYIHK